MLLIGKGKGKKMNTKGIIGEHSKVKLDIYKEYLKAYLAIMCVQKHYNTISIVDPFAGTGKDKNGKKGSAIIEKEVISTLLDKGKQINLYLNELDKNEFEKLKVNVGEEKFISFSNTDADSFLFAMSGTLQNGHCLYFIDPFGYTQVSQKTYQSYLFNKNNADILIFMPIYHIYRFLRKEENIEQLKPIARFLSDLNILESDARKVASYQEFAKLIAERLKVLSGGNFVYCDIIDNEQCNSHYALFFITKHILGAEKFIEATEKIQSTLNLFSYTIATRTEYDFIESIKKSAYNLTNIDLYELGIRHKLSCTNINKVLKYLEKEGKITVSAINGQKRYGQSFYIGYKYYSKNDAKISIEWIGE